MRYTNEMLLTDYEVNAKDFLGDTARFIQQFRSLMEENAELKAYIKNIEAERDSLTEQLTYRGGQSA